MDLDKVLQQLHEELENLDAAIASLERLQEAGKRTADSADWVAEISQTGKKRTRKTVSRSNPDDPQ
jgi:hypothetical protein